MRKMLLAGRLRCASAAFILNMLLGLIYAWSLFVEPLEAQFGWSRANTAQVFTVSMVFFCLGHLASGFLTPRWGPRAVIGCAGVCAAGGFALSAGAEGLGYLVVSYGVLCGFSVGLGANCVLGTTLQWFPGRRGMASGVLLTGVGLGPLLLGPAVALLIGALGFRGAFALLALGFGAALGAGAVLVRRPREGELRVLGEASAVPDEADGRGRTPRAMARTAEFWLFFAWMVLVSSGGLALISNAVPAAGEVLSSAGAGPAAVLAATGAMGAISGFNAVGRLVVGATWDRAGAVAAFSLVSLLYAASMGSCAVAVATNSFAVLLVGFLALGFSYGGSVSVASAFVGARFGMAHYAMNYALSTLNMLPASLIGPTISGQSFAFSGSYLPAYLALLALALVSCVLVIFLAKGLSGLGNEPTGL